MELQDIDLKEWIEKETGQKFNRENKICCPFHNDKTPSFGIKFYPDDNKWRYKCFGGCDAHGDVIDFIKNYKNLGYKKAREYLGIASEKTQRELQYDKILKRIEWDVVNTEYKKDYKLLGLFEFVNGHNEVIYYKAKFLKPDGKKAASYYRFEGDKIINKREGIEEVPYNLCNVLKGLADKVIIIVEGEKDANNINALLRGTSYVATSIKGCTNLDILKNGFKPRIYVLGDTGIAGDKYKWHVHKEFFSIATEFKFVNLPGIKLLGDNKDVTDWLQAGNTKEDLLNAFKRSLDFKNENELQQDPIGVYKIIYDKKAKENKRVNLTDFMLLEAEKIEYLNDECEKVRLKFKSCIDGRIIEKTDLSKIFDDLRSFRNFLGMNLTFDGRLDDLIKFKMWVNKYFAIGSVEVYKGSQFMYKDEELLFITNEGAINKDGDIDKSIRAEEGCISLAEIEEIQKDELNDVRDNIFKFNGPEKSIPIIGTLINNLAVAQCEQMKIKLHHLLMVGEAGSGKSTILENLIAPIMNYPLTEKKAIGRSSSFTLTEDLSTGNYPSLYEEFKPSTFEKQNLMNMISDILRNLYDRTTIVKGRKELTLKKYTLTRPIIIIGEESYPNNEKALMERSCVVYLSKGDRTPKSTEAVKWIRKHENILNKFGKSLILTILDTSIDEYEKMREQEEEKMKQHLNDRLLNTAVNIGTGIQIFNKLLERNGLKILEDYEQYIIQNIKEEVLEGGIEVKSVVEQMIMLYNDMIEDKRALSTTYVIKERGDGLFIKTSEMLNQLRVHVKTTGIGITILSDRDFKKQAAKSGYLLKTSSKQLRPTQSENPTWYDEYSKEKMRQLKAFSICRPDELEQMPMTKEETKVIEGVFKGV